MKTYNFNIYTRLVKFFDTSSPVFAARMSAFVCAVLSVIGISLGIMEDSLAVLSNGLVSAIDILNSFLFLTAVKQSMRASDYSYNYGYGKYESLSLLGAGGMLTGILGFTLYETIRNFGTPAKAESNVFLLLAFSFASAFMMNQMHILQKRASVKYNIPSLAVDAAIWRMDMFMEIGVIINLIIGYALKNYHYENLAKIIDSATASLLVAFALTIPLRSAKNAFNQLLDRTADEQIQFDILAVIAENINKMCEFKTLHTRQSGRDLFIELDVIMPYDFTVEQIFEFETAICLAIKEKYPFSMPRVYVEPCQKDCVYGGIANCPLKKFGKMKGA